MKGSISEFELGVMRARMLDAARQKARRGDLRIGVPFGYIWHRDVGLGLDPDLRMQEVIRLIFARFRECGSARQVLLRLTAEEVHFPRPSDGKRMTALEWCPVRYRNVISVLKNPFYAGVYAYGKSEKRTAIVDGHPCKTYGHGKPFGNWEVMLQGSCTVTTAGAGTPTNSSPASTLGPGGESGSVSARRLALRKSRLSIMAAVSARWFTIDPACRRHAAPLWVSNSSAAPSRMASKALRRSMSVVPSASRRSSSTERLSEFAARRCAFRVGAVRVIARRERRLFERRSHQKQFPGWRRSPGRASMPLAATMIKAVPITASPRSIHPDARVLRRRFFERSDHLSRSNRYVLIQVNRC